MSGAWYGLALQASRMLFCTNCREPGASQPDFRITRKMPDSETPQLENPFTATPPSEPPPAAGSQRSALVIVFLVVFIDLLGFGIVLPLLPLIGDVYLTNLIPGGKEAKLGGVILGLLMSSFSAMQFIFAPIWGRLSDRIGRRPILL